MNGAAEAAVQAINILPDEAMYLLEPPVGADVILEDGNIAITANEVKVGADPDLSLIVVVLRRASVRRATNVRQKRGLLQSLDRLCTC